MRSPDTNQRARCTEQHTGTGSNRIRKQGLPRPRQFAIDHQTGLLADTNQRSNRIEQIQKDEPPSRPAGRR